MKSKTKRKLGFRFVCFLLLVFAMLGTSLPAFAMYAKPIPFNGIEDVEVEENSQFNLLENVSAKDENGPLQITITKVTCETDDIYVYDNSNILQIGSAGSVYHVEYMATSPNDENIKYIQTRTITSIESIKNENIKEYGNDDENNDNITNDIEQQEDMTGSVVETKELSKVEFENGIHYIRDPKYPDERFIIYCMNNELLWPHYAPEMGNAQVPDYSEGYLTEDMFNSKEDYDECLRKLSKILYAGYPYNGEGLYEIVDQDNQYKPTITEFNQMLIPLSILENAFPELAHHKFTYNDWQTQNRKHLDILDKFFKTVNKMNESEEVAGLHKADIISMPFYKAVVCMLYDYRVDPLEVFSHFYSGSYFVTEIQAHYATQLAIWRVLNYYGVPDNSIDDTHLSNSKLAEILYTYSKHGGLLDYEPSVKDLKLEGNLNFSYNSKDGMWHSGKLKIIEPEEYEGIYSLKLPQGITALCDNLDYVYGNEEYELVSDHPPKSDEIFAIEAEFIWLKELKQYSPTPDIEVNGKKFQHMIGAVIRNTKIKQEISLATYDEGGLSITKSVENELDSSKSFDFILELSNKKINGLYGNLEFHNGIAEFNLKHGETVIANYLPANVSYKITEKDSGEYHISSTNAEGVITANQITKVNFVNAKLPELSLSKIVAGEFGDKTKEFTFEIALQDDDGTNVNGTYEYVGSVVQGYENECQKPENGSITFIEGKAEIKLKHGQQITIKKLPLNCKYTIVEREANKDGYTTTYNDKKEQAQGNLNQDTEVHVVNTKESIPDTGIEDGNNSTNIALELEAIGALSFTILYILRLRKGLKR